MQEVEPTKIILQDINIIRNKLSDLEKQKDKTNNFKIGKNIKKIEEELDKIAYYYGLNLSENIINFPIKKSITIKSKKQSLSFLRWLFNNNEM